MLEKQKFKDLVRNQQANVKSINKVASLLSESKYNIQDKSNDLSLRRKYLIVKQDNNFQ
jgi:hypothetical protein